MNNLKELNFVTKKCTICGGLYQELNIDGVNPRGLCDKCMREFLNQKKRSKKHG